MAFPSSYTGGSPPGPSGVKRATDDSSKTMVFLLREQIFFAKPCVFCCGSKKGFRRLLKNRGFSVAGRNGCFKNDRGYDISVEK
jgi:hypothetical protein